MADAPKRVPGQRRPANRHRNRGNRDRNAARTNHRPRHGDRHVLPLLPHHHQHPPGRRIGADHDKRHDLICRGQDRIRRNHDVSAVVRLLGRASGRDAGRGLGHWHGPVPLRQRRQGDRPRRHGDRRSRHSRHPDDRPRPARRRTLPQPRQPGGWLRPRSRPNPHDRQRRQGRRRHLPLFPCGRERHRFGDLRLGFRRRFLRRRGDARRRHHRHGRPAALDPRRHSRHAAPADRFNRPVVLAEQDAIVLAAAARPLPERHPILYAAADQRGSGDHRPVAFESRARPTRATAISA